ncbi:TolC family protein [Orbaceae bacterium ac157xtp]
MKPAIKIPLIFSILLVFGSSLIYFGSRNDAVSVAKTLKSGILTADEVNVAFQNVGGKLIEHKVHESQMVNKGDVLMILEDTDTRIAIDKINAIIKAQEAMIKQEESSIKIEEQETDLLEITTWRKIEQVQASLDTAKANKDLAKTEFDRTAKLYKTGHISQSNYDSAKTTLTRALMDVVQSESQLATLMVGATPEQQTQFLKTKNAQGMTLQSIINARDRIANRANQLDQLKAQLAQSKAELQQLELNLSRLTLVAPEAGKVLKVLYEDGEMVPTGAPSVILETSRKYVDIYVNENLVSNYLPDTIISATVPAIDKKVKGKVRFATVTPSFSDLRMTRERGQADLTLFQVRIYIEEQPQLLAGMTIEVDDAEHH